ncbi:MAG: cytidine deaminase [Anaerolineae bacterium]|nr:cytidine deaminase [Anaerolineae bacterium]
MVDDKDLVRAALEAREKAYAPYSEYRVGAALITRSGRVYTGANVENASYGLSVCAERVAAFKAVSEGDREFEAIAVATGNGVLPCGACRQVLAEFGPDMRVIVADSEGNMRTYRLSELLPGRFTRADLR